MGFFLLLLVFTEITMQYSLVWPAIGGIQVWVEMILTELPSETGASRMGGQGRGTVLGPICYLGKIRNCLDLICAGLNLGITRVKSKACTEGHLRLAFAFIVLILSLNISPSVERGKVNQ